MLTEIFCGQRMVSCSNLICSGNQDSDIGRGIFY